MKLAMLRVSVPVLVMMLLQINPVEGMITRDQATEIFFLAKTDLSAASNKLNAYKIACASEENQEAIYAILDNYLPNAYKKAETQDKIKSEILTSFLGLSEANTTVAGVNEALKNLFISKLFEAYWTINDQIYNDIKSWLEKIEDDSWENQRNIDENRAIFKDIITGDIKIENDASRASDEYFDDVNGAMSGADRYAIALGALIANHMNRACENYDPDEMKRFLKVILYRDVDNDKNAYAQMIDDIIAEQPTAQDNDPLRLDLVTCKIFGRHFADYVGSPNYAPTSWEDFVEGLDEAATDPSKREAAIHDLFTPISEQDANELITNLKLIKEKTK